MIGADAKYNWGRKSVIGAEMKNACPDYDRLPQFCPDYFYTIGARFRPMFTGVERTSAPIAPIILSIFMWKEKRRKNSVKNTLLYKNREIGATIGATGQTLKNAFDRIAIYEK